METEKLITLCKEKILEYIKENTTTDAEVKESDIFVLWKDYWTVGEIQHNAKSLQNQRIVLGVTQFPHTFFDATYSGEANTLYFNISELTELKMFDVEPEE